MRLNYVPLLKIQRDLQDIPRGRSRFEQYLRTALNRQRDDVDILPMLAMNPMAREHVTVLLESLLTLDADGIGASAAAEAADQLADEAGDYQTCLVVSDDLMGGWTNRWAYEFDFRVGYGPHGKRFWGPIGLLWSSEPPSEQAAREAVLTAVHRTAYMQRHGPPKNLREVLNQEGWVITQSGCTGPTLVDEDIDYTREVLAPFLNATDKRTIIECLFGDVAGATLGFTPRGLSPWAGIALALNDASVDP